LFKRFERSGVIVRYAKPGNAQDKEIEQFFRTFHKYCRTVAGWTGSNITAPSKQYRPAREYLSLIYKTNGLPDENTMKYKTIQLRRGSMCKRTSRRKNNYSKSRWNGKSRSISSSTRY